MKHLEDTPWFICDKEDQNMCAYVDTDSNYFNAEPVLKYLYPDYHCCLGPELGGLLVKSRKFGPSLCSAEPCYARTRTCVRSASGAKAPGGNRYID